MRANTRPIRHVRFPFRRRGRKKYWISDYFENSALDKTSATASEFSILEYDDIQPATTTIRETMRVHRVIINGSINVVPAQNGAAQGVVNCIWTLHIIDADDTDNDITIGSQGSILHSGRILQTGMFAMNVVAVAALPANGIPSATMNPGLHIDWRGSKTMGPDDLLLLNIQTTQNNSALLAFFDFTAVTRCLISK